MSSIVPVLILILVLVGVAGFFITTFNRLIMLKNNVQKAFANIDVLLKQRADEVPNIVEVAKASSHYEKNTLKEITELRAKYMNTNKFNNKISLANQLGKMLQNIFVTAENYPDLQANQSYLQLQTRLSELENMIATRRDFYNESVNLYNTGIMVFPDLVFAKLMGYQKLNMLEATSLEKENTNINFAHGN